MQQTIAVAWTYSIAIKALNPCMELSAFVYVLVLAVIVRMKVHLLILEIRQLALNASFLCANL